MAKNTRVKTTIGFWPDTLKAARHRAIEESCDLQDVVDRALTMYLKTPVKRTETKR